MDESLIREQEAQLQKTGRYYKHICFMAVPVLCMACFLYGVRPLLLCGIAVLTGNLCDRLVSLLRRRVYQGSDFSNESFALVIALLMPVTVDIYVLIAAVLAGVLIGKEIFGGYGSYPFNPAAVGYVVAAVSWPEQVFRYPQPYTNIPLWDASMVPVSSAIEDTLRSGGMLNIGAGAGSGRICCSHGHWRCAGDPCLRPVFVDPEGCPHVCIDQLSCDLCGHCVLLPAAGGPCRQCRAVKYPAPPAVCAG